MGLCDELRFIYPLPEPEFQDEIFPLKIFDCCRDKYVVSASGRLLKEIAGNFFQGVPEALEPPVDTCFHGDLSFWAVIGEPPTAIIYQGVIRFTEGQLQWIETEKQPFFSYTQLNRAF